MMTSRNWMDPRLINKRNIWTYAHENFKGDNTLYLR